MRPALPPRKILLTVFVGLYFQVGLVKGKGLRIRPVQVDGDKLIMLLQERNVCHS